MESPEKINDDELIENQQLLVTEDIRSYIYESAKWTKFLSIVGFIFGAFTVMFAFGSADFLTTLSTADPNSPLLKIGSGFLSLMFLIIALLYFYPSWLLYSYSSAAKNAVLYADQPGLIVAMSKLKSFFKFWGIIMIVFISFYLVAILFSILINVNVNA